MPTKITKGSTMEEVLAAYPSAQRALFQRYHIGGCHSCGYQPEDTLEQVASRHNLHNVDEIVNFIEKADETDRKLQVSTKELAAALRSGSPPKLIDVRGEMEWGMAHIDGATLIDEDMVQEMMGWSKDTPIVFYCHHGQRSLDAASYFAGHGFTNVRSMTGGIDAWSQEVDQNVRRYEVARDPRNGMPMLRPV